MFSSSLNSEIWFEQGKLANHWIHWKAMFLPEDATSIQFSGILWFLALCICTSQRHPAVERKSFMIIYIWYFMLYVYLWWVFSGDTMKVPWFNWSLWKSKLHHGWQVGDNGSECPTCCRGFEGRTDLEYWSLYGTLALRHFDDFWGCVWCSCLKAHVSRILEPGSCPSQ